MERMCHNFSHSDCAFCNKKYLGIDWKTSSRRFPFKTIFFHVADYALARDKLLYTKSITGVNYKLKTHSKY